MTGLRRSVRTPAEGAATRADLRATRSRRRRTARTLGALAAVTLAGGGVLLVGGSVGATGASFQDVANLNTESRGLGNAEAFDIALVQDGVLRQADGDGLAWIVDGAGTFLPGTVLETMVPVVNNGPYDALVSLRVEDLHDGAATGGKDPIGLYRWTVLDADTGEVLAGDGADPMASEVTADGLAAATAPFALAARGTSALADGSPWVPGADGSARTLRVLVAYPDTPESEGYNGGTSRMRLAFGAESVPAAAASAAITAPDAAGATGPEVGS